MSSSTYSSNPKRSRIFSFTPSPQSPIEDCANIIFVVEVENNGTTLLMLLLLPIAGSIFEGMP
ncbi:ORF188 [White spot syndrome virus]|uniref:ORF188 n=1 Tax=White spot syndrome virus TaxID=342409 RepID=A0A2D3I701_9VIRU|nr:ORF188 [White spot syndrome virus]